MFCFARFDKLCLCLAYAEVVVLAVTGAYNHKYGPNKGCNIPPGKYHVCCVSSARKYVLNVHIHVKRRQEMLVYSSMGRLLI